MIASRVVISVLSVFLFVSQPAWAGIRPSFQLDASAWNATHIVVVATSGVDGRFNVLESLKGNLKPGEAVFVPELIPPLDGTPIRLLQPDWLGGLGEEVPRQPVGSRLVLFLKQFPAGADAGGGSRKVRWDPTDWGEISIKASVVWLDGDDLYNFCQPMNPGPSVLCKWSRSFDRSLKPPERPMSVRILRSRTNEVIRIQRDLEEVLSIRDSASRAMNLLPFVRSDVFAARVEAFKALPTCGHVALQAIRAALDDVAFEEQWAQLVEIYAEVGREVVKTELALRLEHEADYWLVNGMSLRPGWWNENEAGSLRHHYSITLQIMRSLGTPNDEATRAAIDRVCSLWSGVPRMESQGEQADEITQRCKKADPK